jgi:hypothetical protein
MSNENKPEQDVAVDTNARIVTPTDPLYISYTPAIYDNIEIQGGQIYSRVDQGVITITKLTKTS